MWEGQPDGADLAETRTVGIEEAARDVKVSFGVAVIEKRLMVRAPESGCERCGYERSNDNEPFAEGDRRCGGRVHG